MSVLLANDHKASSAHPLPCIMTASISATLGSSFILIPKGKAFFFFFLKTSNNHGHYSKSQCFSQQNTIKCFILANKQVSDSANTMTQKGISSSVPLNLLGLYKKSLVLTVSNELWIQWDSSRDTCWRLQGPVNRPLGREGFFAWFSSLFTLMYMGGWADSWGVCGDAAGIWKWV